MGIEEIPKAAKVAKAAEKAATAAEAARAAGKAIKAEEFVTVIYEGTKYKFPAGTTRQQAERVIWNKIVKPQMQGGEQKIDLPSELPKADVIPFKKEAGPVYDNAKLGVPDQNEPDFSHKGGFIKQMTPREYELRTPDEAGYDVGQVPRRTFVEGKGMVTVTSVEDNPNRIVAREGLVDRLKKGEPIPQPFVRVFWDEKNKRWEMLRHDGRHRMRALGEVFGIDTPVDVQVMPYKRVGTSASIDFQPMKEGDITDEMRKAPIVGVGAAAGIDVTNNKK